MPADPPIEIHQLSELYEFSEVVRLQRVIWGFDDVELLPLRLFVVASKIGGQLLGAFDGSRMIAFCLCIPGLKPGGKPYLHSHMLGVLADYRNTGIGRKLKLEQRKYAQKAGIDLIEWTFDPLEIKNAFFNIERLGAIVRRYVPNQYGTTSSHLHGGLPTDRLVPEWWIESPRVRSLLNKGSIDHLKVSSRISVPSHIAAIRNDDPSHAREIQEVMAGKFERCFREGLAVTGFERSNDFGTSLLAEWPLR